MSMCLKLCYNAAQWESFLSESGEKRKWYFVLLKWVFLMSAGKKFSKTLLDGSTWEAENIQGPLSAC